MNDSTLSGLDELSAELTRAGVRYTTHPEAAALSVPIRLAEGVDGVLHVRWEPTPDVVQIIAPLPIRVAPDDRPAAAQVLTTINHRLAVAGFHLNPESGAVSFRTAALLDSQGQVPLSVVRRLMTTAMETSQEYMSSIATARTLDGA